MGYLGLYVKLHIAGTGVTPEALARKTGISGTALRTWVDGGISTVPKRKNLVSFADALKVDHDVILFAVHLDAGYYAGGTGSAAALAEMRVVADRGLRVLRSRLSQRELAAFDAEQRSASRSGSSDLVAGVLGGKTPEQGPPDEDEKPA